LSRSREGIDVSETFDLEVDATPEVQLPPFEDVTPGVGRGLILSDRKDAFLPVAIDDIRAVAQMLSAMPGVRKEFQSPAACEPIVLQAALWRISPLFVLQCAYQAKADAPVGYEAKLLHAVILANAPLSRRPRLRYGYGGDGKRTAANRFVEATFWVVGEDEPIRVTSPTVSQIKIKNSPLWFSNPDQQLGYSVLRDGARLHFPDVLGGAYTREEVMQMRDVTPNKVLLASLTDDDAVEADFSDHIEPTEADLQQFTRWERKASGVGDSRDPRDAETNREPEPLPSGGDGPDGMAEIRTWAALEQQELLGMTDAKVCADSWGAIIQDLRWGRLKAYDQGVASAIRGSVDAHIRKLRGVK